PIVELPDRAVPLWTYGWDMGGDSKMKSLSLHQFDTPICQNSDLILCTIAITGENCDDDSGAPMVSPKGLVGIHLGGGGECGEEGVFARLSYYKKWIEDTQLRYF